MNADKNMQGSFLLLNNSDYIVTGIFKLSHFHIKNQCIFPFLS